MENDIANRKTQKMILLASVAVIIWGLYDLFSGNVNDFFKVTNSIGRSPSSRDMSQAVFFLLAVIMAFFSAKNLLRSNRQQD